MARNETRRNEVLYQDHIKMIQKLAWRFSRSTGIEFEELMSEGNSIFMKAVTGWDRKRKFSTFLYTCLENGFKTYARKTDIPKDNQEVVDYLVDPTPGPARRMIFQEILGTLSSEARHVVSMILNGPGEALGILGTEPPKMIRGKVQRYLVENQGLTHKRSWEVLKELKEIVS